MPLHYRQYNWQCDRKEDRNLYIIHGEDGNIKESKFEEYLNAYLGISSYLSKKHN
jgi:hypothetical protein